MCEREMRRPGHLVPEGGPLVARPPARVASSNEMRSMWPSDRRESNSNVYSFALCGMRR